jgi:hypothetical protein
MLAVFAASLCVSDWVVYEGTKGPGKGKHIVFLAGDDEYRSEEGLPELAQILSKRHGFKCTVLFSINDKSEIDPTIRNNQPGIEALDKADLCVMQLRFRDWPDEQMKHFVDYYKSGKPIIALRTTTHAFDYAPSSTSPYKWFDWQDPAWKGVLGETWVGHWGDHGKQATRGVIVEKHPILRDVKSIFGTTDVYEAAPRDSSVLVRGEVVSGMNPNDEQAKGRRKNAAGVEQDLNDPMMPIVWVKNGKQKVLVCTMGAATDFLNAGLRRLIVNGAYWGVGKTVPPRADVTLVGEYRPTMFGFGGYKKGVKPADLTLGVR